MADLEAVLADVSYLIAMEKSKTAPSASVTKKIVLPDKSVCSVITRYLKQNKLYTFDHIFKCQLGYLMFKEFCYQAFDKPLTDMQFYEEIIAYEKIETKSNRLQAAKNVYDKYIMPELLAHEFKYSEAAATTLQRKITVVTSTDSSNDDDGIGGGQLPCDIFDFFKKEIELYLEKNVYHLFLESEKYIRFTQWVHFEHTMQLTMSDFSVHRIIGRGGFGEVYGCRKTDTGKMYAMKCLDKKRIKMKQGEGLALNERNILYAASIGTSACPFIVSMTYAFQTIDKLCFILDLMNGGDLHYHLTQHGTFGEDEVRFYAAEIILGLEHMHSRFIVYRDLKPANVLLDEEGHVRISDLGLACDFSAKKPQAIVGTHGYMAPEVQAKGSQYDCCADWFSLGCLIFKLLRGHSPFRLQQKTNRVEYEQTIRDIMRECRETLSSRLCSLLAGLLICDPNRRLGSSGAGDIKSHPFFALLNWHHVYNQLLSPPIIPPKGEVNAADAFDIGNFDEDDTKGIKLTDADQSQYKNFFTIISERWQQEVAESVFDSVNSETDRMENKKNRQQRFRHAISVCDRSSDLILHGIVRKGNEGSFGYGWQLRYAKLYPNRLELYSDRSERQIEVYTMEKISSIESREFAVKPQQAQRVVILHTIRGNNLMLSSSSLSNFQTLNVTSSSSSSSNTSSGQNDDVLLLFQDALSFGQWLEAIGEAKRRSTQQLISSGKASKIYGGDVLGC